MKIEDIPYPFLHYKFPDDFECAVDRFGIIYIKYPNEQFESPCMKCCFDVIKTRSLFIANEALDRACQIQNDPIITTRASKYRRCYSYIDLIRIIK